MEVFSYLAPLCLFISFLSITGVGNRRPQKGTAKIFLKNFFDNLILKSLNEKL